MKSKPLAIAIFVLAVALLIGFYSTKKTNSENNTPAEISNQQEAPRSAQAQPRDPRSASLPGSSREANDQEEPEMPKKYGALFRQYLGDDSISIEDAASGLLDMAADPTAPMNVRTDALEHALNLTNDANFENVNAILSSQQSAIPELLVQTVLNDSYNRRHITQVDTAFRILTGEYSEELVEEALELLEFHTDENHGNDIDAWAQAVERYRLENPTPPEGDTVGEGTEDDDAAGEDAQEQQ
jgi:hypothetical protein